MGRAPVGPIATAMRAAPLAAVLAVAALAGCDSGRPSDPDPLVLATGTFVDKGGQMTSGAYRIERASGDLRLVLDEAFRTDDGPDLHVVLSPHAVADAGNANATVGGLIVARLMAEEGAQTYRLPDDVDVTDYRSVLVHCVQYRHLFGAAPLTRTVG